MPPDAVPERIAWAVELLAVRRTDRILEIGCGRGVAVSLVCERLGTGMVTAIDRSSTMINAARARNRDCVASGTAVFQPQALATATFSAGEFNKIFAVNVNAFWLDAEAELAVIRHALEPRAGMLHLIYEPPSASKVATIAEKVTAMLERNGFTVKAVDTPSRTRAPLLCVSASVAKSSASSASRAGGSPRGRSPRGGPSRAGAPPSR